ncbi:MAG: NUDIX domain-containing protein [Flavobacteriales bacterium]
MEHFFLLMANEKPYCYEHPRPALTADAVIFGFDRQEERLYVLMVRRGVPPYEGQYAFPGGFVGSEETVEEACHRELREETGIEVERLKEVGVFSDPQRDPRGRIVSVAFFGLIEKAEQEPKGSDDAASAEWVLPENLEEELAFDHGEMLQRGMEELDILIEHQGEGK